MFIVKRSKHNPILSPRKEHAWESFETFNGCPIKVGSKVHLLYRAQSTPQQVGHDGNFSMSTIGRAISKDGHVFSDRKPFITPEFPWERYGCEDPRVTKLGNKYYIFYTALGNFPFSAAGIKVAVAVSDDLKTIQKKHLVTPFNAKAMSLFPEKINGKFTALLSVDTDLPPAKIAIAQFENEEDMWNEAYWNKWYGDLDKHKLTIPRKDSDQVEVGSPPIKTKEGWLLIYSHIENYMSDRKIFSIRAVLLDLEDPKKVIAQTPYAIFVPEEEYELHGVVPNITFPSGALLEKDQLRIYYGGADTVCAVATVNYRHLLNIMLPDLTAKTVVRSPANPILKPNPANSWEARAVFNPTAVDIKGKIHILYRAMSLTNTSVVGYAASKDGLTISERSGAPIYEPREDFEIKKVMPSGNSGCEDARITKIDDTIYMCYTAYNGIDSPAVAVTTISEKNFLAKNWKWSKPVVISPDRTDDKDACIFPDKIQGKYMLIHRINHVICADYLNSLDFTKEKVNSCTELLRARQGMWDARKVGLAGAPLKTKIGYVMLYHGIGDDGYYRLGAALLDLKEPMKVIARTNAPILEPRMAYEMEGQVNRVVFPCGAVIRGSGASGTVFIYYGGADSVTGVATMKLKDLLSMLVGK